MPLDRLVTDHLWIAPAVVRRTTGHLDPDLCQEAALGIVQASRTFDPGRGYPFRSVAWPRALGRVLDAVGRRTPIPMADVAHHLVASDDVGEESIAFAQLGWQRSIVEHVLEPMSPRHARYVRLVLTGASQVDTARTFGVSEATISMWMDRFRAECRTAAARWHSCSDGARRSERCSGSRWP